MSIDIAIKYITNREGLRFFSQRWIPSDPKALVLLVHGIGDHSNRYSHVINYLASLGYAVAAYDHRGHGLSDGRRGDLDSFTDLIQDLHSFAWETRHLVPEKTPVFLLAQDVGALVALNYSVTHPSDVDGLVTISPAIALDINVPKWMRWCGNKLVKVMPRFPVTADFQASDLTRDDDVIQAYERDPLVFKDFTLRACHEIIDATSIVMSLAFRVRQPILMMQAKGDKICSAEATRRFFDHIPDGRKKLVLFDGSFHEPFNDLVRDEALSEIKTWLDEVLSTSWAYTDRGFVQEVS